MQCYTSAIDLEKAITFLIAREPRFLLVHKQQGTPSLRQGHVGLEGLLMIVTEQFLSLAAAAAIWARVHKAIQPFTAAAINETPTGNLKVLGLSKAKIRTFQAVAEACESGALDFASFAHASDDDIRKVLLKLPGIGPWTADIYLLSALQRCDSWPAGDLALQMSAAHLFEMEARPSPKAMIALAENWRPHRAAAARLLWAHYRGLKRMPQA